MTNHGVSFARLRNVTQRWRPTYGVAKGSGENVEPFTYLGAISKSPDFRGPVP